MSALKIHTEGEGSRASLTLYNRRKTWRNKFLLHFKRIYDGKTMEKNCSKNFGLLQKKKEKKKNIEKTSVIEL